MIRTGFGFAMVLSVLMSGRVVGAATVVVPPGPGTPVQDAIDAAAPGTTIRLLIGAYPEHIVITKSLKLRGVRSISTQINDTSLLSGTCSPGPVLSIVAAGVTVRGIAIAGDSEGGVDVRNSNHVKIMGVFVASNCSSVTVPAFNVEQSTRVKLNRVWAAGANGSPGPAGVRLADIAQSGKVRLGGSIVGGAQVGVLLENVDRLAVRVSASDVNFNDRGIVLQNTSGAIVDHNRLVDNTTSGIQTDAGSSGNSIVSNTISGSSTDVMDSGADNCWHNNTFTTGSVPACP
jgi:hypothetical protein